MSNLPPPSRVEYLLEQILVKLTNIEEKMINTNVIENKIIDSSVNVFDELEKDDTISVNTKKNYKKHLNVILKEVKSFDDIVEKDKQDKILSYIITKYDNLNTQISYFSSFKYLLKATNVDDICGLNKSFQNARQELTNEKAMTNKSILKPIKDAKKIWNDIMDLKKHVSPTFQILLEIYDKLGVIRSSEVINMRFYIDKTKHQNISNNYIDFNTKLMIIKDHKTYNKTKKIKEINLKRLDLELFKNNLKSGELIFPQSNGMSYADSDGFNKMIIKNIKYDYTLLRKIKVSLVFAYGTEEDKKNLSYIHGTALTTMCAEYQNFVKLN